MNAADNKPASVSLKFNLASQIVLLATGIAAATAGAFAIIFHLHLGQVAEDRYAEQVASHNRMLLRGVDSHVSTIEHDHAILARSAYLLRYVNGVSSPGLTPQDRKSRLQDARLELSAFLNASNFYTRISLLPMLDSYVDQSAVSISRVGEPPPPDRLSAAYVRASETFTAAAHTQPIAFISTQPSADAFIGTDPRIVSISPLYDSNGSVSAIIAIEADYRQFLDAALQGHDSKWGIAVVDSNGNYSIDAPTIDLPGIRSLANDHSEVASDIARLRSLPIAEPLTAFQLGEGDALVHVGETTLGTAGAQMTIRIASIIPSDAALGEMASLAQLSLILFTPLILLSAGVGAFFGHRVAMPLRTMNNALLESRDVSQLPPLPVDRCDEIGEFARSFTSIIENLRQQMRELDRGNIDLHATNIKLATANEEIRGLTHIISHDLRAPLVNLMGFSEELSRQMATLKSKLDARDIASDPELAELLDIHVPKILGFIEQSAEKMEMKLDVVLNLARLGRYEIGRDPVKIQTFFETAVANQIQGDENVTTSIELQHVPEVLGDRQAAEVFAENLIGNAYKYRDASRPLEIKVTAELDQAGLTISVADNGRGISEVDAPKVFKLFGRVGTQDTKGQGVGLSYCKALATRVGGNIWFESEPGEGTTFFLYLPSDAFEMKSEAA